MGLFTNGEWLYIILILLVGATTYFSFSLNKTTSSSSTSKDPMANMTNIMTGMIIIMGIFMPTALCIYWIINNLFTIIQNLIVKRSKEVQ